MNQIMRKSALVFVTLFLVSCSEAPPKVDWVNYVYDKDPTRASELKREVYKSIATGDCKSAGDWLDYSYARVKLAETGGGYLSYDMTEFVEHYMGKMECYYPNGNRKTVGLPVTIEE